ncbi:hypothetical protein M422DRAFT_52338 [Sphaerobolus stellatus SS14]|uniref:Uncharacterized protein n=1 Tax=Sphaerobolus stellatus (strain SS14) TaxID=990650 RepID=A0A0C9TTN8_SPHS4|nr:hypothetical protein M422DRAFT_52338 [Sphaerobolus stellatus SS14]
MSVPTANLQDDRTCQFELSIGWSASILVAFISTSSIIVFTDVEGSSVELKPGLPNQLTITRPRHVRSVSEKEQKFTIKLQDEKRKFQLHTREDNGKSPEGFYLSFGDGNDAAQLTSSVARLRFSFSLLLIHNQSAAWLFMSSDPEVLYQLDKLMIRSHTFKLIR